MVDSEKSKALIAAKAHPLSQMPAADANILAAGAVRLRPLEGLKILVQLAGPRSDDPERDRKAAVLSLVFVNRKGEEVAFTGHGFSQSEKYGTFKYIPLIATGSDPFEVLVRAPPGSDSCKVGVFRFTSSQVSVANLQFCLLIHSA